MKQFVVTDLYLYGNKLYPIALLGALKFNGAEALFITPFPGSSLVMKTQRGLCERG